MLKKHKWQNYHKNKNKIVLCMVEFRKKRNKLRIRLPNTKHMHNYYHNMDQAN